ncbi:DNA polymerase [Acinetobacter baumannii]|uniref:DNA polymerase n=1 Tax=Acinetobacter baumannii TaxID=470 RepID=UPI00034B07B4|nr:DNA polymerase [Acinetobacter baumannii]RCU29424.1 DNA polymerase I [Acinetobacter baumannii]RCU32919.1 DNA polymerase I [Acinetobacter baumannii]RCU37203.1 DNA polymerase I [Acinetobacter baumannii]
MEDILWLDLETYCPVPIKNGTHAYAEQVEIIVFAWAFNEGPVYVEDLTKNEPSKELIEHLHNESVTLIAHNSHFDRTVLRHAYHGAPLKIERWQDTMVQALSHSLPGSLDSLCEIFKIDQDKAKDKAGKQLIQLFCKPRPANQKLRRATCETHPLEWARFLDYAKNDILAMRELHKRIPKWNYRGAELTLWHLDQKINDRGVCIDLDLVESAIEAVAKAQKGLAKRTVALTDGEVQAATQRDAMLKHILEAHGVSLPDMQKATLERRINDENLPVIVRELLAIRLQASTTSTAKYTALAKGVSSDGRLRGTLQFNGASRTGRWAGRLFQPQNLPRPTLKQDVIDEGIETLKIGCADMFYENVMELTSSAIRGCICAPEGKKLVVADLSNIEGRALAWLAGEIWKLKAFYDFDAGEGHDLYKLSYAKSFSVLPDEVDKDQRQVGKVQELALGYEGGVGAFLTFAAAYGLDLDDMAAQAFDSIDPSIMNEAIRAWEWHKKEKRTTFGLKKNTWLVCDSFKRSWRYAHPNISAWWNELRVAAINAINNPDKPFPCRKVIFIKKGSWLYIKLPSGRFLCYPGAKADDNRISYMGNNQYTRKWERLYTYGGKFAENITQAVARDVLGHNMPLIESSGYEIALTVHDEVITEANDVPEYNHEHLSSLLASNPEWALDLPLAAAGFESYRYKKD